ncbi:MAG TPA: hypothetical protein VE913_12555 [Longimicrobium sp.]|nr:hypothetical protein [Longimicrobium sp.]
MVSRTSRPDLPPDPIRDRLKEVRLGLLRLHKSLIDSERGEMERRNGAMSNGQFLQVLINDEAFAWLRPYSELIVRMDEVFATREPIPEPDMREYVREVVALIAVPEAEPESRRYEVVRRRDAAVGAAHVELTRRIAAFPAAGA